MSFPFRHSAGFGKRMEYYIIGLMLKEGLDCYVPLVDDDGIDCVIRKDDGHFIEIQIKARSNDVKIGDAALFAALEHEQRENYFFIFYSERLNKTWILSSQEFLQECVTNKTGKMQENEAFGLMVAKQILKVKKKNTQKLNLISI